MTMSFPSTSTTFRDGKQMALAQIATRNAIKPAEC
jgi:hypothetical protein